MLPKTFDTLKSKISPFPSLKPALSKATDSTAGMSVLLANRDRMQSEHSSAAETAGAPKCGTQGMLTQQQPLGTV